MLCEHCGQVERVENAPCPSCKFQPYNEGGDANETTILLRPSPYVGSGGDVISASSSPEICPECGTPRSDPNEQCERCKELDVCPTPDALALAICRRVVETTTIGNRHESSPPLRILEPSAGDGAFVRAARQVWPASEITAVEIREQCQERLLAAGATSVIPVGIEQALRITNGIDRVDFDLVIGNPPFSFAEQHIRLLLGSLRPGAVLAFLLRTGFYESHTRIPFWNEFPEDSFAPVVPRPSFKLNAKGKKGTDSQSYGLFVWTAGEKRPGVNGYIPPPRRDSHIVWRDPSPRGRKKRDKPTEPHERLGDTRGVPPEPEPEPEVFDLE